MRKLRRSVFYAVVWVYLLGTSLSATHIHHQLDTPDHDCKVCLVVKNIHASDVPSHFSYDTTIETYRIDILPYESMHTTMCHKGFDAHAPPLS